MNHPLFSKRLQFRLINLSDLENIHALHSLPETDEFNALGVPENLEETNAIVGPWILENKKRHIINYTFAIEAKINQDFIGLFGFKLGAEKYKRAEVWFKIHSDHWNKGYATEALKTIIDFGFQTLHLHRIQAGCAVHNLGSINVLEKAGMTQEGRGRQVLPLNSGWSDNFEYSILETDIFSV
ncbi:MAG: ribosomal-protein-alanine N-acetyltransferase [Vicingaceae bacterium]|jgi:ribosomal-protein-alanine N-acetyltransferase